MGMAWFSYTPPCPTPDSHPLDFSENGSMDWRSLSIRWVLVAVFGLHSVGIGTPLVAGKCRHMQFVEGFLKFDFAQDFS
eukprot:3147066-Lingulodinium_polyedra.AAC.1